MVDDNDLLSHSLSGELRTEWYIQQDGVDRGNGVAATQINTQISVSINPDSLK